QGPENQTLQHWNEPRAIVDRRSGLRWSFKCHYCDQDTGDLKKKLLFEDEPQKPRLGNLATHTKEHEDFIEKVKAERAAAQGPSGKEGQLVARLMENFVENGILNLQVEPTQSGFNQLFAAWLIKEDLPFTTGEAGSVQQLFKYIQCCFMLPSDTRYHHISLIVLSCLSSPHAFSLTLDNVSSNTVLACVIGHKLQEHYGAPFHPDNLHICCLAHVVNIVIQKILSVAKEADDPEIQDYYECLNKQFPVHYNLREDEELQDFENEDDSTNGVLNDLNDGLIDQETGEQDGFTAMSIIEKVSLFFKLALSY
ncbi:hypothetical protein EDB86DRAFT_2805510, partial [Lactarius hatsudake]